MTGASPPLPSGQPDNQQHPTATPSDAADPAAAWEATYRTAHPVTSAQYLPADPGQPVAFPELGRFAPAEHGAFQHPPEKRSVLVLASVGQLIGLIIMLGVVAGVIYLLVR